MRIRTRLLGVTTAVVALALIVTVVLLRQVLLAGLTERVGQDLVREANEFASLAKASPPQPGESEPGKRILLEHLQTNVTSEGQVMVAMVDGEPILQSLDPPGDITPYLSDFVDIMEPLYSVVETEYDGEVVMLGQPLTTQDEQLGVLVIAHYTNQERRMINRTSTNAAAIALGALVASILFAWLMAGRALRPIGLLAQTAKEITEGDLDARLPAQGANELTSLISSFNTMVDRLQNTVQTQRRFLDDAGHELRTPLTIMRGQLEVAGADPEQFESTKNTVVTEIDRMTRIVNDLLTLAKVDAVEFIKHGPIDTDELVSHLFTLVQPLGKHDWGLSALPVGVIEADSERLTQAVLNLAKNAARHTPEGNPIYLGAALHDVTFDIWVEDTGEGIEPEQLPKLFERFHRASGKRDDGGNAGLGLAIVRAIAEAHGGSVAVESAVGHGSRFTITIPIEQSDNELTQESLEG